MTKEFLRTKLQNNPDLRDQFNEELAEREAIMAESRVPNVKTVALEATVEAWLLKKI